MINRRTFLVSAAMWFVGTTSLTRASTICDHMPWSPVPSSADEARAIEPIVDRIIPPDPETPGGKNASCAVFIDRQLKSRYGSAAGGLGPYTKDTKEQGPRSPLTPAELYRKGLAGLAQYCKANEGGKTFDQLPVDRQDDTLKRIEAGEIKFDGVDAHGFFDPLLKDVPKGFFSDPIHGGNRDMVGWKMIGFPGIRYDDRDWIGSPQRTLSITSRQHRWTN